MSVTSGRRKEKIVYEDIPIIVSPTVNPVEEDVEVVVTTPTGSLLISPNEVKPVKVILAEDKPENEGFLEIVKPLASMYTPGKIIYGPKNPVLDVEDMQSAMTTENAITDLESKPTIPIEEEVSGWGRVFGSKSKKIIRGS